MSKEYIRPKDETGQTMAEYTFVLGLITITIVATFSFLSDAIYRTLLKTIEVVQTAI